MSSPYKLEMLKIKKRFGGVEALKSVDFKVNPGEIHALVGENGAGKSTLMKVLSGVYAPDEGEIYIDGEKIKITDTKSALSYGISVIYQEFALAKDLSVAENIFLEDLTEGKKTIHWRQMNSRARVLLEKLNFGQINENAIISDLSVAYQQVVEICKALSKDASILVLDEPTALLASSEAEQLFKLLLNLKSQGTTIIYISHRLDEIFKICDRITVLKDGSYIDTVEKSMIDDKKLVNMMIGRDLKDYFPHRNAVVGETLLEVVNLKSGNKINDVSFQVCRGEVLGIAGLVGSGRTETARAIYGVDKYKSGKILLNGKQVNIKSTQKALEMGIGFLSEDRKSQGVLLELPIKYNVTISVIEKFRMLFGNINKKKEDEFVDSMVKRLNIKTASINSLVANLSGGNQQKVSIAKLLATECKVLIFDEPTRGIDVGSKIEIYNIINHLAEDGYAIIMISSEMEEIIGMCDRCIVMRNGSITGELNKKDLAEENIIRYAMGVAQ
jgi:ribose transport system ATP-binding protein